MRRIFLTVLVLGLVMASSALALENSFLDFRSIIFEESKEVKALFEASSPDIVVVSAMWDTCLVGMSQLDSYFYMLQLFNTIKQVNMTKAAVDTLSQWLAEIKKTSNMNITLLGDMNVQVQEITRAHMEKLKNIFTDLNAKIDEESAKLADLSNLLPQ